jgi:serine/threonine protein kinase
MLNNVLEGLYYIHKNVVIHRDIKPENIIFQEDIFKITDFGVSSEGTEDENFVGTPLYFPPEMLFDNNLKYTQKVDVWSLGVSAF